MMCHGRGKQQWQCGFDRRISPDDLGVFREARPPSGAKTARNFEFQ